MLCHYLQMIRDINSDLMITASAKQWETYEISYARDLVDLSLHAFKKTVDTYRYRVVSADIMYYIVLTDMSFRWQ